MVMVMARVMAMVMVVDIWVRAQKKLLGEHWVKGESVREIQQSPGWGWVRIWSGLGFTANTSTSAIWSGPAMV